MPVSKNTRISKGDILYVCGYNGTDSPLWMTPNPEEGDLTGQLDDDEPVIFLESTDVFYRVVTRLGIGWIHRKDVAREKGVSLRQEMSK